MIKHAVIYKYELPTPYTVKLINLRFLDDYVMGIKRNKKDVHVYELHGMTYKQMRRNILSPDKDELIERINSNFPTGGDIYSQSAYYFRAFSRSQIFYDANHRTGYFCLWQLIHHKGYELKATIDDVQMLGTYLKNFSYVNQGDMDIFLKEKDEVYDEIYKWLRKELDLG